MERKQPLTGRRIADLLQERIEAGEWPRTGTLGDRKMPARGALLKEYGSSLATIAEAIRILRVRGFVVTRAGGGTYTRPPRPERIIVPGTDEADWTTAGPVVVGPIEAMSWVRDALGLNRGDTVHRVRTTLMRNGDVYAIFDTYATHEGATVAEVGPTDPADRIRTWLPADDEAALLGMPQEVPVIALLNETDGGVNVRIYPGDRIEYRP